MGIPQSKLSPDGPERNAPVVPLGAPTLWTDDPLCPVLLKLHGDPESFLSLLPPDVQNVRKKNLPSPSYVCGVRMSSFYLCWSVSHLHGCIRIRFGLTDTPQHLHC